ncbi:unnamed protein product [Mesocestoides corti]|uniref:Uncharacterized protein n=1 Tax=Mesocestoides corti TaxID=53468 RepID=A0A0R3ULA4_MESCO|nr:unnamed protein product [Mesocestoides corti]
MRFFQTPNSRTNAVVSVGGKNGGGGGGDSRFLPTQLTLSAARGPPTTGKTIFLSFPPYPCTPLVSTNCHYLQIGSVFEAP